MNLREIINFEIFNILVEIKTKFDLRKFKQIKNIEDKFKYVNENLQKLGEGTSRITFLLNNKTALKIANPKFLNKGLTQNKSEINVYQNINNKEIITQIYDYDTKYEWIISELVRPIKNPEEFKTLTNIDIKIFKDIMYDIAYSDIFFDEKLTTNIINKLENIYQKNNSIEKFKLLDTKFLQDVINLIENFKLDAMDLGKFFHWGKAPDGRIALLDYGYTEEQRKRTI